MSFEDFTHKKAAALFSSLLGQYSETARRELDALRIALEVRIEAMSSALTASPDRVNLDALVGFVKEMSRASNEAAQAAAKAARAEAVEEGQRQLDEARAQAAAQLDEARADGQAQLDAARAEADRQITEVLREASQSTIVDELLEAFRAMDAGATLSDVLNALVDHLAAEFPRAALFVVRGDRLTGWRSIGFDGPAANIQAFEIPLTIDSALTRAVSTGQTIVTGDEGEGESTFGDAVHCAVALPLAVGYRVVAVAYGDDAARVGEEHRGPMRLPNPSVAEILVMHAARCLSVLAATARTGATIPPPPVHEAQARPARAAAPGIPQETGRRTTGPRQPASGREAPTQVLAGREAPTQMLSGREAPTQMLSSREAPTQMLSSREAPKQTTSAREAPTQMLSGLDELGAPGPKGPGRPGLQPAAESATQQPGGAGRTAGSGPPPAGPSAAGAQAPVAGHEAPTLVPSGRELPTQISVPEELPSVPIAPQEQPTQVMPVPPVVPPPAAAAARGRRLHVPPPPIDGGVEEPKRIDARPSATGGGEPRRDEPRKDEPKKLEDARRYARLLVSEIKLYNEAKVMEGRRRKDLYERLKTDIERCRRMYSERVGPEVQSSSNYFDEELVRILADGDASVLGRAG